MASLPVKHQLLGVIFLVIISVNIAQCDRITGKIYKKISDTYSCFRRLNGTHEIGCSSAPSGNVGVVHFVESDADAKWLVEVGPHSPYVAVVPPQLFRRELVLRLKASGKINGVIVFNGTSTEQPASYSPDNSCPNRYSSLYTGALEEHCDSNPWNPAGDSMLFENWGFPIFFVDESKLNRSVLLDDCFDKFNRPEGDNPPDFPLCAVELKSFMWAAVDTPTCRRRGELGTPLSTKQSEFCDPLGNINLVLPILAANKSDGPVPKKSVIILAARLDSFSLFDNLSPGADSAHTAAAAVLSAAEILSKLRTSIAKAGAINNVYVVLFNGEAFDYIGSSRMVYDMSTDGFPARLDEDNPNQSPLLCAENIKYFIELNQIAPREGNKLYAHTDPLSTADPSVADEVDKLFDSLKRNEEGVSLSRVATSLPLPPASLQSFLKNDTKIPGIVLTSFQSRFNNPYYNSEWDTAYALQYKTNGSRLLDHIASVATTVASSVYELATGNPLPGGMAANKTLLDQMLQCYLVSANCSLFSYVTNGAAVAGPSALVNTYVSVSHPAGRTESVATSLTRHVLAYATGELLPLNKSSCMSSEKDQIYYYYWIGEMAAENRSGACYRSLLKMTPAVSPAFIIDDYDWKSGEYSTWTESRWETFSARIFVKSSFQTQISTFVAGLIVFLVSILLTYWASSNSSLLFSTALDLNGTC